jgi:hypothetical protein
MALADEVNCAIQSVGVMPMVLAAAPVVNGPGKTAFGTGKVPPSDSTMRNPPPLPLGPKETL